MLGNSAFLGAFSALLGALIGASASVVAAIYTQRYQDRLQRVTREITKREAVYADFIMHGSKLLMHAYVHEGLSLDGDELKLIGLANRMRLFAPAEVLDEADAVIKEIAEISLQPSLDPQKLTLADLAGNRIRRDLLLPFSLACREDLDHILAHPKRWHRQTVNSPASQ